MMAVKPISPKDAVSLRYIPDEVIESFNELIAENLDLNGKATFRVDNVICRIINKGLVLEEHKQEIYDKKWLDIENIYEPLGWIVKYHSPSYGDSCYESFFTFEPKKKKA